MDSGKSARLLAMHRERRAGCGVVSVKVFAAGGLHVGYDALLLPSMRRVALCRLWGDGQLRAGKWHFSQPAFENVSWSVLMDYLAYGAPVTVDEVGRLEARGLGFAPLLHRLTALKATICIGCRD